MLLLSFLVTAAVAVWNPFGASADELLLFAAMSISIFALTEVLCDTVFAPLERKLNRQRDERIRRIRQAKALKG